MQRMKGIHLLRIFEPHLIPWYQCYELLSTEKADIDPGEYTLTELSFEGTGTDTICLENVILSGPGGSNLSIDNAGCQEFNFYAIEVVIIEHSNHSTIL